MGIEFQLLDSISAVTAAQWNDLWQGSSPSKYPFVRHEFLAALEDSGCTSSESGWIPRHLIAREGEQLLLAMPLFLKNHSWGEYVFDWAWAEAYQRNGLHYYPKLVNAIPFTPATGPRLACLDNHSELLEAALTYLKGYCDQQQISGLHSLFPDKPLSDSLRDQGLLQRHGCQFHWFNQDYRNFEHFLERFASRKRKNLRKERQQVLAAGVELKRLCGTEISPADWDAFYQFYHITYLKRSGATGYLNREFFERLSSCLSNQLMMVMAYHEGQRIAASLCFFDEQNLYGRYWGCRREIPGLHFEACYYQGIEFAIERGLQRFDPGAQGEHKIQRGFEPVLTVSNHWLIEPAFQNAVGDFLRRETPGIAEYQSQCSELLPFKKG